MSESASARMRGLAAALALAVGCVAFPGGGVDAQQPEPITPQEVMERASYLKNVLEHLLAGPNFSSIRKVMDNGDPQTKALVEKALESRALGESALEQKNHLEAVVNFQASIEYVFEAIRGADHPAVEEREKSAARLARMLEANQTFIAAAARVVEQEPNDEAAQLLQSAKEGRARAEAKAQQGDNDAAVAELAISTDLAKRAISSVRGGQVIERTVDPSSKPEQ